MKAIYYYKGQEVVLAYEDEVVGIKPIAIENNIGVYPAEGFPFGEVTPCLTLDDCYTSYSEPEEIEFGETINPENEEGIVLGWLRKSEALRQKAILDIKSKKASFFHELMCDAHCSAVTRIEVTKDGKVRRDEYISSTDYTPNVEVVYSVGGVSCNCDTCKMYQDLDELTEDDFIELYGKDVLNYCIDTNVEQAIIDCNYNNYVTCDTIRDEIIEAINDINADFFKD